ncbi:hypothetical protein H8356DRAFT_949940 [Neocallimastix lanati (nom. inval.)]|nr:hypothetical protein H8356DRAFT_949940 [Neocallimastix sp. JGI-2020a]
MSRIDNFCSGSSFDSLYNCEGGLCKLKESYVEAGTYIVGTDLYVCTGETGSVVCTKDDGSNNGINVFKKYTDDNGDTLVQLTANLTTVSLGGADKYQIFDCKSAMCTRTSGYIKYGSDNSSTGKCASDTDCADQAAADATGFTGNAGTLTFTGSGFTYTVTGATGPSTLTSGNDYFFVYDTNSKYDYLSFKNANIVAIAKNVGTEVYITSSTNVVGNDAENCNSNTYYKYVIADADAGTINTTSSAQCPNGYYLKATDDSALANAAEAGTIYKCVDQSCKALDGSKGYEFVYGIVPNADAINKATVPYIVCAGTTTCKTVAVTDGSDCSSATQGQIISPSGGVYALCVVGSSATGGVTITTSNESNYILPMTVFNSADTSGKYVMVSFDGTNVTKDVSNTNKYNYTGADNKIYSKKDNSRICAEKVYEYTKDEAQPEYTLTDEKSKSG